MPLNRLNFLSLLSIVAASAIIFKLFVLQIVLGEKLSALAENQHFSALDIPAKRGQLLSSDNFSLVTNQKAYLIYATLPNLKEEIENISKKLSPLLLHEEAREELKLEEEATKSAQQVDPKKVEETLKNKEQEISTLLSLPNRVWVPLKRKASKELMEDIKKLNIYGLGFEEEEKRFYPEASASAHALGIVASDANGRDRGYFGLEGYYNGELKGRPGRLKEEIDAQGRPILVGSVVDIPPEDGRDLVLTLDRSVGFIVREKLREGIKRYGAKGGSIVVMDPKSGAVLAMDSIPSFDLSKWNKYERGGMRNPSISEVYEPGSTFKVITASAAIDSGVINLETRCPCSGPLKTGGFEIRTWNNKYHPNSTLEEILQHSDNVGATFIAEKLGVEGFLNYVENFGFGKITGVDLEGEGNGILRDRGAWQLIDLYTASFGQGHSVTMMQMIRAVSAIANGGMLMQPQVVRKTQAKGRSVEIKPKVGRRVIKKETSSTITEMMVSAVEKGEARHFVPKGYRIAGKTGTAQIPIEGRYDPSRTVASFIGFAPADEPKFTMLVRLDEPSTSPWGSTTAAPLFFEIAKELFAYWGIPPNR